MNRDMDLRFAKSYRDLVVWQKSMDLVVAVYELTWLFPKEELYGLSAQMRRAAVSIPSNIAEGWKRNHKGERMQSFSIAYASGAELETQIEISKRLKYVTSMQTARADTLLQEIMRMLNAMLRDARN